ncbi:MFS transporter [Rhodoligotrophos defluvii]|uniref:MFS transporter n=1 Tax=Rhodoligotrophos defluvii TaxID=2561934 RepID=UPI00148552EB|nr:MFS transporter [Rhodoligotrophos defluvii]
MEASQFGLLTKRRFLPLFVTQALGAFDDNVLRNAIAILITFHLAVQQDLNAPLLVTVAAALFVAPFFLFSALAGQLADKYEKGRIVRAIKLGEVGFALVASASLFLDSAALMLSVLFISGTLATFFGPIKYGILPQHLSENELIGGNAMVETGTFLAILLGLLFGGLVITTQHGVIIVSATMILTAIIGYLVSFAIPKAPPPAPELAIDWNPVTSTKAVLAFAFRDRTVLQTVLCISWFWAIGAVFLAQFPGFTRLVLGADEAVSNLLIAAFTVGIAIGSLLCNRLLKGAISARFAPIAGLVLTLCALDLVWASSGLPPVTDQTPLLGIAQFLGVGDHWRILLDLVGMAVAGGVFVVPLYAIMQAESPPQLRSRIIAAANVMNAVFMTVATGLAAALLGAGLTIHGVFLVFGLINLVFALSVLTIAGWRRRPATGQ